MKRKAVVRTESAETQEYASYQDMEVDNNKSWRGWALFECGEGFGWVARTSQGQVFVRREVQRRGLQFPWYCSHLGGRRCCNLRRQNEANQR